MLSKKQMRHIIKKVYRPNDKYGKQIERLYKRANRQIKGEISTFIRSRVNWSGIPSKDDLEDVREELEQLSTNSSILPLVAVYLTSLTKGHPKVSDVETARIAIPLLNVAKVQHRQMQQIKGDVPYHVAQASINQHQITPHLHRLPNNYNTMLQKQVSSSVRQRDQVTNNINRDIKLTKDKVRNVVQEATHSPKDNLNWAKQIDRVLTGDHVSGGASSRAKMIIRTQSCKELNKDTVADFKTRKVKKYRFLSLEGPTTCKECSSMDGNVYDVDDAEEGVNLPPMHPNCQCWIQEFEDEE